MATDVACQQVGEAASIPLLSFGNDLPLRKQFFVPASMGHPAKLHLGLLQFLIGRYTRPGDTIADPMCGTGSILLAALQARHVIARDVEPQWLDVARANATHLQHIGSLLMVGNMDVGEQDARQPWGYKTDHVLFSPPYGNEASPTPSSRRMLPYRLTQVSIPLSERWQQMHNHPTQGAMGAISFHYGTHADQIGHFRGKRYWQAMSKIYNQAHASLGRGYLIVIVKDHIKDGQRVPTADRTIALCQDIGFQLVERFQRLVHPLSLWQRRRKEQGLPVVEEEDMLIFRKGQEES
jgi:tRNA G10  N-methylase Trm11